MAHRLNHENLSFKLTSKESERSGRNLEIPPMSIDEIQQDIYKCGKCSDIGNDFCDWHIEMIQGRYDLFIHPTKKRSSDMQLTMHQTPINPAIAKQELFNYLKNRGRVATTDGRTLTPPRREFSSQLEEILNLLGVSSIPLTQKEISNLLGIKYKSVQRAMWQIVHFGNKSEKYIRKTKVSGKTKGYRLINPTPNHPLQKDKAFKIIINNIKSAGKQMYLEKKRQASNTGLKKMAIDVLNTYPAGSKFTMNEFVQTYKDFYEIDEVSNLNSMRSLMSSIVHSGHISSERIPGEKHFQFTKVSDIPLDISLKYHPKTDTEPNNQAEIQQDEDEGTEEIIKRVPLKLMKQMEKTIQDQHELLLKTRSKLAEILDENAQLNNDARKVEASHKDAVKRLEAQLQCQNNTPDYNFDLTKFQEMLK